VEFGMIHELLRMGNLVADAVQARDEFARSINCSLGRLDAAAH
jgi:hypothetical protein